MPHRVLILGGGLSGLSAGIHLLENSARPIEVTIACMEPQLGGKVRSWRHPDGRMMETGFHAIFGYYSTLRELLERCGRPTTDSRWFSSNHGEHLMYETCANAVNHIHLPRGPFDVRALVDSISNRYQGMSLGEKLRLTKFAARMGAFLLRNRAEQISPEIDEMSFTAFCMDLGLDVELTKKCWFTYVLDLAFNYPHEGSAYVGAYGFRKLLGYSAAEVLYVNGGLSEVIVDPVARYFQKLGGKIELCQKAVAVEMAPKSRTLKAVRLEGQRGQKSLGTLCEGQDFDTVVWTLPLDCTRALLQTTPQFNTAVMGHHYFRSMWMLRTVASISMRIWSPIKLVPPDYTTVVMGLPQPTATLIDYANRIDELKEGPYASVLEFEGQEGLHASYDDETLKRQIIENFVSLPFSMLPSHRIDDVLTERSGFHCELQRNSADHRRYLLMEPGHWKYRPDQEGCPYDNLVFAGDWLKSAQPTASMEAAVMSGKSAAAHVVDHC